MSKRKFRLLKPEEIEVRIGMVRQTQKSAYVTLLLYKNARCDMSILDETVGAENWQRKQYECKNNLYCSVGIKCGDEWIWKDDCGSESNVDKEKGEASDAFKRACVNWGIGRELYTTPTIYVSPPKCTIDQGKCRDTFRVKDIGYDESGRINRLEIVKVGKRGSGDTVAFEYSKGSTQPPRQERQPAPQPVPQQEPPQALICPKCGNPITAITTKSGAPLTPETILHGWGMCFECYKESRETQQNAQGV